MKLFAIRRPSPALIVAIVALVAAMSGAAVALPGKGTVSSNDIKENAVKSKHINRNAVKSPEVKGKSLKGNDLRDNAIRTKQVKAESLKGSDIENGTLTGADVKDDSLDGDDLSDYEVIGSGDQALIRATATDGATADAARAAAVETALFSKGQVTLYGKCFRDISTNTTFAEIYVRTSADGAVFDGSSDELEGGAAAAAFLNTSTLEVDRQIDVAAAVGADPTFNEGEFSILTPDGTHLIGQDTVAAKNGALAGGNGVYGDGNVCLFGGEIAG